MILFLGQLLIAKYYQLGSLLNRLIVLGIVPTSELVSRSRVCNDVNPLIVLGIVPPILLLENNMYVMLPKVLIEDGNVPLNDEEETLIDSTRQ